MSKTTLTLVVHGDSGVGKSWLADTAPAPRLILDAEGGTKWTPSGKVKWNPLTEDVPAMDGPEQTCVVTIRDFNTLGTVMQWLESGKHPFQSVVLDSLTEIQKRCLDNIAGSEQATQQNWGELLRKMEVLVRRFRDLTMNNGHSLAAVVFVCGSQQAKDGITRPHVQGQLGLTLPYFVDAVGYLHAEADATDGGILRKLLLQPIGGIAAKDRTGRFGISIANPSITEMLTQLEETVNG